MSGIRRDLSQNSSNAYEENSRRCVLFCHWHAGFGLILVAREAEGPDTFAVGNYIHLTSAPTKLSVTGCGPRTLALRCPIHRDPLNCYSL